MRFNFKVWMRKTLSLNLFNIELIYVFQCFRLGSDPYKLYPFKIFQMQLQKFGKFGLLNASVVLPIFNKEVDLNGTQNSENENGTQMSDSLKKRLRDIVSDCQRLGYI